jgi:hypothetical protein
MHDTSEFWSTPWRRLHKTLANGSRSGLPGEYLASRRAGRASAMVIPTTSWLVRARSRSSPGYAKDRAIGLVVSRRV